MISFMNLSQTGEGWWTAWGSNPRPPRCERGALPAELAAHPSCGITPIITFSRMLALRSTPTARSVGTRVRSMVLSDIDIKRYLAEGKIRVSPELPPEQFGSCSVDFRLGSEFSVFEHSRHAFIDPREKGAIQDLMR